MAKVIDKNWKSPVRLWKADDDMVVALDNGEVVVRGSNPAHARRIAHEHNNYVLAYAAEHDRLTAEHAAVGELVTVARDAVDHAPASTGWDYYRDALLVAVTDVEQSRKGEG